MSIIEESLGISKESLRSIQGKMLISEKKRGQNRINNRSGGQEWVESLFRTVKREDIWRKLIK